MGAGEEVTEFYQSRKEDIPLFVYMNVTGQQIPHGFSFKVYTDLLVDEPDYVQGKDHKDRNMSYYLERDSSVLQDEKVFGGEKFSERALVFGKYDKFANKYVMFVDDDYFHI